MTEVAEPNLKEQDDCGCGCGLFGTLKKPWRTNGQRCVRRCSCKQCSGKKSRDGGDSKARAARKVLAISGANTRHEELWGGALRVEVKSGGIVAPAYTAFVRCEQQSEVARSHGDTRPFAAIFMPSGTRDGVVAFRMSDAFEVAAALLENLGSAS